ncbi:sensor domain-containing diguanylate cyclase [Bowmanella pacifica]|uniref:diguanylate cyclase n=1 Tax=Bowmanella pacifica TaxID=502051 RepID=A0A918DGY6_9ALTE|nr:diguanylate cyclase [Bowmanella pacifica]GGO65966.1 deoxynucleoside kinase [Bowmanella pacifica]
MATLSGIQLRRRWLWLYGLIGLLVTFITALKVLEVVATTQPSQSIGRGTEYLLDSQHSLEIATIHQDSTLAWQTEQSNQLSFGMRDATLWLKVQLPKLDSRDQWLLEVDYALLDELEVWFFDGDKLLSDYVTGDILPFRSRNVSAEKFLFPVPYSTSPLTLIIRSKTTGALKLPLNLWNTDQYLVHAGEHSLLMGAFFGLLAAMALSNFFFFVTTRYANFLVYCGYVLFLSLTLLTLHGIGYKYFWPNNIWLQGHSVVLFANATMLFAVFFTRELLQVKSYSPLMDKGLLLCGGLYLTGFVLSLMLPYWLMIKIFLVVLMGSVVFICSLALWLSSKGIAIAKLYALAWFTLLLSGLIASLENLDFIDLSISSHYLLMIGALIESILLALVLAITYNEQREATFIAQGRALEQEIRSREHQKKAQEELEYNVQERTLELEIALRELSEKNEELEERNTQDALTGIRNRRYFDKKYIAELRRSRREQTALSVAMLDIDHFKSVNDKYGHLIGDECIRAVARLIQDHLRRPADDVCRYGGEEFALLLPNTDIEGAVLLLEQIRQAVAATPIQTPAGPIQLTISGGIASSVVAQDADEMQLLSLADQALYKAKQAGRNQICHHTQESSHV